MKSATIEDIPLLVELGRAFHGMSPHASMGDFDGEGVANMLRFLIQSPTALVLTNGEGAIGGVMAPLYFCPRILMMEEAFWYADKGGRDLLKEFGRRAKEMGASLVYLSTLENKYSNVINRVVTRMGYRPVERRYVMEL